MMSVIVIVALFFVFGITVGVIGVIAMSARGRYKWHWQPNWPDPAGPDPAGPDPAGPDPAGPDPAGPDQRAPDLDGKSSASGEYQWWKSRDGD